MWHRSKRWLIVVLAALTLSGLPAIAAEINDLNITDASNTARFPENMAPSAVNDGARALEGLIARWDKDTNGSKVTTGSANAYVFAANQTLTAYYDGLDLTFDANFTNTGAATINVDALGAKSIVKNFNEALGAGDITAGQKVRIVYDGTNFQMMSPVDNALRVGDSNGGDVALTILNEAGSGSTDETNSLIFQHVSSGGPGGKIVSARASNYSSGANEDSILDFYIASSGTDQRAISITQVDGGRSVHIGAVDGVTADNANMDFGLTVWQGSADDEIFAFKSSDVAHGVTTETETDTFAVFKKESATTGILLIKGYSDSGSNPRGLNLQGWGGTSDNTKSTAGSGHLTLTGHQYSGTGVVDETADGNIVTINSRNGGSTATRFIFDTEGTFHADVGSTTFDEYDDVLLGRALTLERHDNDDNKRSLDKIIVSEFDRFANQYREELVEAKIIGRISDEDRAKGHRPLLNMTYLAFLDHGAIWQGYVRDMLMVQTLEDRLPGFGQALQARLDGAEQPPIRGVIFANDNMVAANDNELRELQEENAVLRSRLERIEDRLAAIGG